MSNKVVLYAMNYAPEVAGVGKYTGDIGRYFGKNGVDLLVVTAHPHYPGWRLLDGKRSLYEMSIEDSVKVIRCPLYLSADMAGIKRVLAPLSFAISSAPVMLFSCLRIRPDVIIVVEPTLFVVPAAIIAAKLVGARTVLHVQDLEIEAAFAIGHVSKNNCLSKLAASFDRWAHQSFDSIITISNKMASRIISKNIPPENISVIRNWVDLKLISPEADGNGYRHSLKLGVPKESGGKFIALYSGNLGLKQGLSLLLDAAFILLEKKEILFVIAGDGPFKKDVVDAVKRLDNIVYLPFQPEGSLGDFLRMADVHLLPQEKATADLLLPSKLGGMLASGRPLIVTAEPNTELSDFLCGAAILIQPGSVSQLADAIMRVFEGAGAAEEEVEARLSLAALLDSAVMIERFRQASLRKITTGDSIRPAYCD